MASYRQLLSHKNTMQTRWPRNPLDSVLANRPQTALTRLDEIPLRLVETETHGSPWHELASSDLVRQAIATVPGFTEKITDFAKTSDTRLSAK